MQSIKPKTSSALSQERGVAQVMFDRLPEREKRRAQKGGFAWLIESLLTDLANLHDQGHERFWGWKNGLRQAMFGRISDGALIELRNDLRKVWDERIPVEEKNSILFHWLESGGRRAELPLIVRFEWAAIFANPTNMRAQLAFGAVNRARRLAICSNPTCSVRYFLAKRRGQKYCERGDCTAYAQRQYALNWWKREHSSEKRKRRTKS
jgi:hypothetical protein